MKNKDIILNLPDWFEEFIVARENNVFQTMDEKMSISIEAARLNVENQTGGPFGTAIFDETTGRLISIGANFVVSNTFQFYTPRLWR